METEVRIALCLSSVITIFLAPIIWGHTAGHCGLLLHVAGVGIWVIVSALVPVLVHVLIWGGAISLGLLLLLYIFLWGPFLGEMSSKVAELQPIEDNDVV